MIARDIHEYPMVNVISVTPRHHDGIRAILPTPNSSCGRGVHPILRALLSTIISSTVSEFHENLAGDSYLNLHVLPTGIPSMCPNLLSFR